MYPTSKISIQTRNNFLKIYQLSKQWLKDKLQLRSTFGDRIIVSDQVCMYEGTQEQVKNGTAKLIFASKGHIVTQGLIAIVDMLAIYKIVNAGSYVWTLFSADYATATTHSYMKVGTGGSVTAASTTALTTPNATLPSSQAVITSNVSAGVYRVAWTATWNAGTLTAIVLTEIGLWLAIGTSLTTLQSGGWIESIAGTVTEASALFSRLSEADGDFVHFTVNTAVPLTIQWNLTFTFA